jgi:hypothetical protein
MCCESRRLKDILLGWPNMYMGLILPRIAFQDDGGEVFDPMAAALIARGLPVCRLQRVPINQFCRSILQLTLHLRKGTMRP